MYEWLGEENDEWGIVLKTKVKKILYRGSSKNFKEIIVGESKAFGKILVLKENDNFTWQVAEKWDSYSEMLVHVPMCSHPKPERILVIGGGDGSTVREILKHKEVQEVVIVDIDDKIVNVGKNILNIDNGALKDPRVKIIVANAIDFVRDYTGLSFDIIIGDYSDPMLGSPASDLIKEDFIRNIKAIMNPSGILTVQSGSPIFQREIFIELINNVKKWFKIVSPYSYVVPFYPGGIWSFVAASDKLDPRKPLRKFNEAVFYNEKIHEQIFQLPNFMLDLIKNKC